MPECDCRICRDDRDRERQRDRVVAEMQFREETLNEQIDREIAPRIRAGERAMPSDFYRSHHNRVVCPNCKVHATVTSWTYHSEYLTYHGEAKCYSCSYTPYGLDISYRYDTILEVMEISGSPFGSLTFNIGEIEMPINGCTCDECMAAHERILANNVEEGTWSTVQTARTPENDGKVYVVVSGEKEDMHIVQIYSHPEPARELCYQDDNFRVIEIVCSGKPINNSRPFPVYVISVGVGDRYRIIEISTSKKQAAKIATSIRGAVSVYEALPSPQIYSETRMYKYFVNLEMNGDDGDVVYYVDNFYRRHILCEGEEVAPIVTRRRRYNSALPYRLEVAAVNRNVAEDIAFQLSRLTDSEIRDTFEYNVDYEMIKSDNNKWEIKPSLLEAVGE